MFEKLAEPHGFDDVPPGGRVVLSVLHFASVDC